jgi:glyoxylase-like metal-dependent hydrolase (beta-lactamase superfamily II)
VACETSGNAALIDPLRDHIDRYLALLAYHGYKLAIVIDTHTHADHRTGSFDLNELTGAEVVMHREAPAPRVGRHVGDGDTLFLGELALGILATPGHTPDSMSIVVDGRVFTGDTLLIRGTGRADFAGGDAGAQYDSITGKLFALPDSTIVLPAHDYRGNTESTIGEEKPLPTQIQEVLQPNQTAIDDDALKFPTLAQLSEVRQLTPQEVQALGSGPAGPTILDVREPDEFTGPLGHIPGSQLIPLKELARRVDELEPSKQRRLIAVCRSGVRSTTAAAILTSMGFEQVFNMKGGMLAWNDAKLPVKR